MRVNLRDLQKVVSRTLAEEKAVDTLREEVTRALGPSVVTDVNLERLAEGANDRLDVLERTGRMSLVGFKPAVLLKFATNPCAEARRLAARLLPEQFVARFKDDKNAFVRHAAAKRLPINVLKEMIRRSPQDDELRAIYKVRKLTEAGLPNPKKGDGKPFDIHGEDRLGDTVKQKPGPELSDQWYETTAHKAISDYNGNIEGQWDEPWAHRYCSSLKSSYGIDVDEEKLWKEIQKQLKDKDDRVLERYSLKEVARRLRESNDGDVVLNVAVESVDPVTELLESDASSTEYVKKANAVFSIRESTMPAGLRKYMVSESRSAETKVPCLGRVPMGRGISRVDERALDAYVKHWNAVQSQRGEPIRISWSPNPNAVGLISFAAELK